MPLFFIPCGSFRIVDGTLFMFKDEDGTSIEKLSKVHIVSILYWQHSS
jgi:hypothetical protein